MMKKLLLVDDDEDILALLKMKLEKSGRFSVVSTSNPEKAAALARREAPDLVICDIDMPEMTGGDVAAALADDEHSSRIPVLFFSSLIAKTESGKGVKVIGGRRMVSKSASIEQLIAAIDATFE